jgi:hypothetical protein
MEIMSINEILEGAFAVYSIGVILMLVMGVMCLASDDKKIAEFFLKTAIFWPIVAIISCVKYTWKIIFSK